MADQSDFKRRQIVDARMAGANATKADELFGATRSTVLKIMTNIWERRKNLLTEVKLWKKAKTVW